MADIFISYRRGDSAGHTGRLVDRLERHFGSAAVFQDVQSIQAGTRWDEVIAQGVAQCRVLVAVIGKNWLSREAGATRRIDDPQDYVRREIATALARGVPVIPVLVEGARPPSPSELPDDLKPLASWQAHDLSDSRWDYDTRRLAEMIERAAGIAPVSTSPAAGAGTAAYRKPVLLGLAGAAIVAGIIVLWPGESPPVVDVPPGPSPTKPSVEADKTKPAPAVPARFEGSWYGEDATHWGIRQSGDRIEINHTAPGSGTAIGYAEGKVSDRIINFEYVVMVPDEPRFRGELVLSDDGKRLTGVLSDIKNGGNTHVSLRRRE